MSRGFDWFARPLLFSFEPEMAHSMSIAALKTGLPLGLPQYHDPRLRTVIAGIEFANPLGMAAGYDKNGEVPDALLGLGFGFCEIGTVTPFAQAGNPKPRLFRLPREQAVINRLGFNNEGHEAALRRLRGRRQRGGIIGVNIGANKESSDRIADYRKGVERFALHASYLVINISSPNTPGLRDLQGAEQLGTLMSACVEARARALGEKARALPLFVKVAPDIGEKDIDDIAAAILAAGIDGLIVANTTLSRKGISDAQASEAGGLSGKPVFKRSTAILARFRKRVGPELPLIGLGGIDSGLAAAEKMRAGADLIQLYTALIFAGPTLPRRILRELSAILETEGLSSVAQLRDRKVDHWASQPID